MKPYPTLLFDLCGTIMQYRIDKLPLVDSAGGKIHSTTPFLYACFREFDRGRISFEKFHSDFISTTETTWRDKAATGEEILASTRFKCFLKKLDADLGPREDEIHRLLMDIHLERVAMCLECHTHHRDLLVGWKNHYRMGLITNFDDTKTIQHLLERDKIRDLFEVIIISAEIGIRKPHQEIFFAACESLNANPAETLFIGDSWADDIVGAKGVGMDTAWINPDRLPQPETKIKTNYDLSDLAELKHIL